MAARQTTAPQPDPAVDASPRARKSAGERRDENDAAASGHFAVGGYAGTSTEAIARDAGISQPYLFRLFGTKRDLFLACQEACHQRVLDTFRRAAEGRPPEERLEAMGLAYVGLLEDRTMLLFQMQGYAAGADAVMRARVRECYGGLIKEVRRLSGASAEELWRFFGNGMLLNVIAALDLPAVTGQDDWAALWTDA